MKETKTETNQQVLDVYTGDVLEGCVIKHIPSSTNPEKVYVKFWPSFKLNKDGTPSKRDFGTTLGVEWLEGCGANGQFVRPDPEKEKQAIQYRQAIERLRIEKERLENALFSIYAGPIPE